MTAAGNLEIFRELHAPVQRHHVVLLRSGRSLVLHDMSSAVTIFALLASCASASSTAALQNRLIAPPRLEALPDAQRSVVARVPRFLSDNEIVDIHLAVERVGQRLGSQDIHKRQGAPEGSWSTVFMNHHLLELLPSLHQRLLEAACDSDAANWRLLDDHRHELAFRCVEYHSVSVGGGIPMRKHHDFGSLLTLDVMLSDPSSDFEGGRFCTLEADGTLKAHTFERGDLLIFQAHKYHCVQPVNEGRRTVLVAEIWEGLPRRCPRRCNTPWGPCDCQFAPPAPSYLTSNGLTKLQPCLRLMSRTDEELRRMMETQEVAAERQTIGAHALWKRRQALNTQRAQTRG